MTAGLVIGIIVCAVLGLPLFAMFGALALTLFWRQAVESGGSLEALQVVIQEAVRLSSAPALGAIPLFTFAGFVLARSKAPQRLVDLSQAFLGWMPGGLGVVALISCAFFTAFTGASGVTIIALGGLLYPILLKDSYPEKFSLGLITTTGSLGLLFPPSLPLILYAIVAKVDIGKLFMAGILPGILLMLALSFQVILMVGKTKVRRIAFEWSRVGEAVHAAGWELPLPFLVLGGIYGGFITATEAAAITSAYVLIVEVFIRKEIDWLKDLPKVVEESMILVGGILIILGCAMGLTNYMIDADVPGQLFELFRRYLPEPGTLAGRAAFLVALNILLLIVGCLMDIFSALVVVVPLILPISQQYGVEPLHLGIIFLTNLEIGYLTPPVGLNLFLSSFRFGKPIPEIVRSIGPFLVSLLVCLLVITYWPALSLFLPSLNP